MSIGTGLHNLRKILEELYSDSDDISLIIDDVGLPSAQIDQEGKVQIILQKMLKEAAR